MTETYFAVSFILQDGSVRFFQSIIEKLVNAVISVIVVIVQGAVVGLAERGLE